MAETSRGRQMVFMATRPRYHVVKLLELDEIKVIKDEDISPSDNMNLKIVQYSGKAYHAVEFGSGDYVDMALTKDRLVDYERKLAQFRGLGLSSKSVQTESSQSKSPGHKSQYVQTDMDAVLEEQSPERTYSKLRSAMESLIGPEDFQSPQFDWANTEPIDEIYQDEHDSNRQSEITTQQPLILPTSDHEERDDDSNEKSAEKDGNADNRTEDSTEVQSAGPTGETKLEKILAMHKCKNGLKHEIMEDVEKGLAMHHQERAQFLLNTYLGVCHIVLNNDWATAISCFQKELDLDPTAQFLTIFKAFDGSYVNLLEMVINHLKFYSTKGNWELVAPFLDKVAHLKLQKYHL